jgi:dihydroorotate dehydrogenase (NAD+) catalytic subunit
MSGPAMAVAVGGLELASPVLAASGTFGYGVEMARWCDLRRLGGFVTKGLSLSPRPGNPPPRICETASGMLNAIGLANLGLEAFIAEKLPAIRGLGAKVVANLYAERPGDFAELAARLEAAGGVHAVELNVSCPNVAAGGMAFGVDPAAVAGAVAEVKAACRLPVWVKLTPNVTDPAAVARAAEAAGADALCLINTLLGMAIDAAARRPRLANVVGGLSGPAIKPVALRMVWQVARAVSVPVVGIGGITGGEDAAEFLLAGARAVQVGTASLMDPAAAGRVAAELEEFCAGQGVADVNELVGALRA